MNDATATARAASEGRTIDPGEESTRDRLQMVSFEIDDEVFAIDILPVREIVRTMNITPVPHSPPHVQGVVNLRGQITPVVDLRQRFGRTSGTTPADSRIVVVEMATGVLGFTVDRVHEVLTIPTTIVDPAPFLVSGVAGDSIRGVAKLEGGLVIILDLDRLFSSREFEEIAAIDEGE